MTEDVKQSYRVMPHEFNYLVVTTPVLEHFNKVAKTKGYNRTILGGFFDPNEVDEPTDRVAVPHYPVTCQLAMAHYHKEGRLTLPHVRTTWSVPTISTEDYLSVAGKTFNILEKGFEVKWVTVSLDIPSDIWEELPTIRPYSWLDIPPATYVAEIYDKADMEMSDSDISDIENYLAEAEKEFLKNVEPMDLETSIQNLNDAIRVGYRSNLEEE
tara:strand:- start:1056 stop:1694 length:639 start_codon:yes stop_codon:yes gene_type:complete